MRNAILIMLSILMASCSARYSPFFWGYGEWTSADFSAIQRSSAAVVDWSAHPDVITSIDGIPVGKGYKKARLAPGKHQLVYADHPAGFGAHPEGLLEVDLLPGHEYDFRIEYCFWCSPRKYATRVDDKTTGELLWGNRPAWPFWWL